MGGQKVDTLDVVCKDLDIILAQEVSRGKEGWDEFSRDEFQWLVHRSGDHWRGVGIGVALDRFDSFVHRIATSRGIWAIVRIRGLGRVVLGSLHGHTEVTNDVYQSAIHEFVSACPRKYRHLPLLCGVDANEVPKWTICDNGQLQIGSCSTNLNLLLHEGMQLGVHPISPEPTFQHAWSHFPRDESRSGRQIGGVLGEGEVQTQGSKAITLRCHLEGVVPDLHLARAAVVGIGNNLRLGGG